MTSRSALALPSHDGQRHPRAGRAPDQVDAESVERPASDMPPTAVITSPVRSPALAAGEPGNTSTTSSPCAALADVDADPA